MTVIGLISIIADKCLLERRKSRSPFKGSAQTRSRDEADEVPKILVPSSSVASPIM
jgi:hypothetical protein